MVVEDNKRRLILIVFLIFSVFAMAIISLGVDIGDDSECTNGYGVLTQDGVWVCDEHIGRNEVVFTSYESKPTRNTESNIHGGLNDISTDNSLNPTTNVTFVQGIGKILVSVEAGSDIVGTVHVKGTKVDRNTGELTYNYTDNLTLSGLTNDGTYVDDDGHTVHNITDGYLTNVWFYNNVEVYTTDLTLTDVDFSHISFEQFNDRDNMHINTLDVNAYVTNANGDFSVHMFALKKNGGGKANVTEVAHLSVGYNDIISNANKYYRLRRGNLDYYINGTKDGIWLDVHYDNSPTYVEDVTIKVWATEFH